MSKFAVFVAAIATFLPVISGSIADAAPLDSSELIQSMDRDTLLTDSSSL